jgi:hypothetical protein
MMWTPGISGGEVAEMFVEILGDHGCVVLDNPIAKGCGESGHVIFWPDKLPRTDAGSDQDGASATVPMRAK